MRAKPNALCASLRALRMHQKGLRARQKASRARFGASCAREIALRARGGALGARLAGAPGYAGATPAVGFGPAPLEMPRNHFLMGWADF